MPSHAGPSSAIVALPPRARRRMAGAALLLAVLGACQAPGSEGTDTEKLAFVDSILTELGGRPTADMARGQRWRMISSIGAGLPPSSFQPAGLPEAGSTGAVLVQTYCQRCHWLPAPQMHAADEWPLLVRRMVLRARTLQERMGGPVTEHVLGDILLSGMSSADVPTPQEVDTLVAYLQAHAMPTASPDELGTEPEAQLFQQTCSLCHQLPSPGAHTATEWEAVVVRMRMNAALMDVPEITGERADRIIAYLTSVAPEG